jgi:hypothetical protein
MEGTGKQTVVCDECDHIQRASPAPEWPPVCVTCGETTDTQNHPDDPHAPEDHPFAPAPAPPPRGCVDTVTHLDGLAHSLCSKPAPPSFLCGCGNAGLDHLCKRPVADPALERLITFSTEWRVERDALRTTLEKSQVARELLFRASLEVIKQRDSEKARADAAILNVDQWIEVCRKAEDERDALARANAELGVELARHIDEAKARAKEKNMKRYQFVWWGWRDSVWQPYRISCRNPDAKIYKWRLNLGPLEIRKWKEKKK